MKTIRLTDEDRAKFAELRRTRPHRSVRVYADRGNFLPRSYHWPAQIEFLEYIECYPNGHTRQGTTGATRPFGQGDWYTIR